MSEILHDPVVHFRGGGTSVVVSLTDGRLPRILHWGADLGPLSADALEALELAHRPTIGDSVVTYPQPVPMVPQLAENWLGRPGISGSREGAAWAPKFGGAVSELHRDDASSRLLTTAIDSESQLVLRTEIELFASGVVRARAELQNDGGPYRVESLEIALPVPDVASDIMDFTGRWSLERVPQRHPFAIGQWMRESRGGKPGLDNSMLLLAGVHDFGFRRGRTWGIHLGWSGNQVIGAERTAAGTRILRAGELLLPDEVVLQRDERYSTPWVYGSWGDGLDELAARFHRFVRSRPGHPSSPRPVLVNTWEAVYFDHDPQRIMALAEKSAGIGAERFVVDDGWFRGRSDDTTSLGDWVVDSESWPDGLRPLADRVHDLGMEFGLWFEPEMISLDSDLARAHPDWLFDGGHGVGDPSRYQYALDLGHPDAYAHILESVSALVDGIGIDFIKWDHNRYLTDAGHQPSGRAGVHVQTEQLYRMLDELQRRHPRLEIESCASGGGRIDLGILERTDRVWASDCNDPHERLEIQRWTGLFLPPELLGDHIGAEESHTTHRHSDLDFRAATAVWGNLGVELDLTRLDDATLEAVGRWVAFHKQARELLHSGIPVHADFGGPGLRLDGVVAPDRAAALYQFTVMERPAQWPPERLRFGGLDPSRSYLVTEAVVNHGTPAGQRPPWMEEGIVLPGSVLADVGIEAPSLDVDRSVLISVRAEQ
jgi:alpha-galactosidase